MHACTTLEKAAKDDHQEGGQAPVRMHVLSYEAID
jgi:hypothetical protein